MRTSRWLMFCTVLFTVLCFAGTALAGPSVDENRAGSVTLRMMSEGQALQGGTVTFYQVADIDSSKGGAHFRYTKAFENAGYSLESLNDPDLALSLKSYADFEGIQGMDVPVKNGKVYYRVPKGSLGLYLVVQTENSKGDLACTPFLISVPNYNGSAYEYDVDGTPKTGIPDKEPETPEQPEDNPDRVPGELDDDRGPGTHNDDQMGGSGTDSDGSGGGHKIPQTGTLNWPVPVLTVLGLGFLLGGFALSRKEKNNSHEK